MHRMLEQQLRQLIDTGEKVVDVWIRIGSSQPGVALIDSPSLLVKPSIQPWYVWELGAREPSMVS